MSSPTRESFATEVDAELLSAVRTIAQDQGRALESLVDEAFADLVVKLKPRRRPQVMDIFWTGNGTFDSAYNKRTE